jgi:hypothetical protein
MRVASPHMRIRPLVATGAVLGLLLGVGACGLDAVKQPAVGGTAQTGISVQLTALPDTVNADGVSQSTVQLVLRDQSGNPVTGRSVLFELNGDGRIMPSASSTYVGPVQQGLVMATDNSGSANVVYVAGTSIGTITIGVRPYASKAEGAFSQTVAILLD